jgi:hypothetical protein
MYSSVVLKLCSISYFVCLLHIYYQMDLVFGLYAIHGEARDRGDPTDFGKSVTLGS